MSETRRKLWRFPEPVDETSQPEPPTPENTSSMVRVPEKPKTKPARTKCPTCKALHKTALHCDAEDEEDDEDGYEDEDDDDEFDF